MATVLRSLLCVSLPRWITLTRTTALPIVQEIFLFSFFGGPRVHKEQGIIPNCKRLTAYASSSRLLTITSDLNPREHNRNVLLKIAGMKRYIGASIPVFRTSSQNRVKHHNTFCRIYTRG